MKPIEIMKKAGIREVKEWNGYADEQKIFNKYLNVDCVISYEINSFGCIMIIKGAKKYFVFVVFKKMFVMPYSLQRVFDVHSILNEINFTILNKEEYIKYKRGLILKNLK